MASHFQIADLLRDPGTIETGFEDGARFSLSLGEAARLNDCIAGVTYGPRTLRIAGDVSRILSRGGSVTIPRAVLHELGGASDDSESESDVQALFGGKVSTAVVVLAILVAAVVGFATGHRTPGKPDPEEDGAITVTNAGGDVIVARKIARTAAA